MAFFHDAWGVKCKDCSEESDLVLHQRKDPLFKRWVKYRTYFEFHHIYAKQGGEKLFRLGDVEVPAASNPEGQLMRVQEAANKLKDTVLLCRRCHMSRHINKKH